MSDTARLMKSPALLRGFSASFKPEFASRNIALVPLCGTGGATAARNRVIPAWEVLLRIAPDQIVQTVAARVEILAWARAEGELVYDAVRRSMAMCEAQRPDFAGLPMDRAHVMGILNVTPDSFSDGGRHFQHGDAVASGLAMLAAGATVLDVGGESTRPGADPVSPEEEIRRVVPVIQALAEAGAVVSIDTRHSAVMGAAVDAGAAIINDVTALTGDPDSLCIAARAGVPVVLMHMRGEPRTMQADPVYDFAPIDVLEYLQGRVEACLAAGIPREAICTDTGLGFGKTVDHNAELLIRQAMFHGLGCPVLMGISRKTFIGKVSRGEAPPARVPGSLAAAVLAAQQGVQIIRVHDVAETVQALAVWNAADRAAITSLPYGE